MKRRSFLILSALSSMRLVAASLGQQNFSDDKSLVCIFLYGGNDAFNMWVPYESSHYDEYAQARQNLAIPHQDLLPIADQSYAFHPSLSQLRNLYDQGRLAVISNLGNLIVPTSREDYLNDRVPLPAGLFSHSHQQEIWQTNLAPAAAAAHPGWGGLIADQLSTSADLPISYSIAGSNLWLVGQNTQFFSLDAQDGVSRFEYFNDEDWPPNELSRSAAWRRLLDLNYQHVMVKQQAQIFKQTKDRIALLQSALALTDPDAGGIQIQTPYNPENPLASQLRIAARMIYARSYLGQNRQLFFTAMGGWDTHGQQLDQQARLLSALDEALNSFQATLDELGLDQTVLSFTASDFGRTLTSNGDGTDHGWGGHALVMGSPVIGGQLYGEFPSLVLGGPDDAGNYGRLIPKIAVDQYGATLAQWLGLSPSQCQDIFPNLNAFNSDHLGFV